VSSFPAGAPLFYYRPIPTWRISPAGAWFRFSRLPATQSALKSQETLSSGDALLRSGPAATAPRNFLTLLCLLPQVHQYKPCLASLRHAVPGLQVSGLAVPSDCLRPAVFSGLHGNDLDIRCIVVLSELRTAAHQFGPPVTQGL